MWPQWLTDALKGKVSLSRAFWLYGLGVSVVYSVIGAFIDIQNIPALIVYLLGGAVLGVLQSVILWRCSYNSPSKVLGTLVRGAMLFGLLLTVVLLYVLVRNADLLAELANGSKGL